MMMQLAGDVLARPGLSGSGFGCLVAAMAISITVAIMLFWHSGDGDGGSS